MMMPSPSLPGNVRRFIRRLNPDEPFFVEPEERYSGPVPRSTKYWCVIAIAINVAISVIAAVVMRSLAPILIACMASLFPAYMLLFWGDLASTYNGVSGRREEISLPVVKLPAQPSLEWIGICLAIVPSAVSIIAIVVAGFNLPH